MRLSAKRAAAVTALALAGTAFACGAPPDPPTSTTSEPISTCGPRCISSSGGVVLPPSPLPFPPPNPQYCWWRQSTDACQVYAADGSNFDATAAELGCSPPFTYWNGNVSGTLGYVLSLCPSTLAVYQQVETANFCDQCVPAAPQGQIYAIWEEFLGPCASGCPGGQTSSSGGISFGAKKTGLTAR